MAAVVRVDHVPRVAEPAEHLAVERVLLVRAVEREGDDGTVTLHEDGGI
jgi:hypothetical protein